MALYHFDIYAPGRPTRYNVDSGCNALADAKRKAIATLTEIAFADIDGEQQGLAYAVHVTDRDGALAYAVTLSTARIDC